MYSGCLFLKKYILTATFQITVFAPSDEALKNANLSGGIQILEALSNFESQPSDIQQLVKDHIVPGLYYFNNLTQLSRSKGGSSLKNENGGTVYLSQANETSIRGIYVGCMRGLF